MAGSADGDQQTNGVMAGPAMVNMHAAGVGMGDTAHAAQMVIAVENLVAMPGKAPG